jgi:hypothetical protein
METRYEPKKRNQFIVTLPKEFGIQSWAMCDTELPSVTIDKFGNFECNEIPIRFRDVIGHVSTGMHLFDISNVLKNGYLQENEDISGYKEFSDLILNGFTYTLELTDPVGSTISKWVISECKITHIDFGKLDYGDDGILTCEIRVKPAKFQMLY